MGRRGCWVEILSNDQATASQKVTLLMFHHIQDRIVMRSGISSNQMRSHWRSWISLPLGFVLAAYVSFPASAQTFYGSIAGRVSDKTGAIISGASVKVTNLETSEK